MKAFCVLLLVLLKEYQVSCDQPELQEENAITVRFKRSNLVTFGDKQYYFGSVLKANWFLAESFCRQHDMDLVSITSKEENDFLKEHIATLGLQDKTWYTSGTDLGNQGSFRWASTGHPVSFTDWNAGEPSNTLNSEHCIEFYNRNGNVKWNDVNCDIPNYYICEIRPTIC